MNYHKTCTIFNCSQILWLADICSKCIVKLTFLVKYLQPVNDINFRQSCHHLDEFQWSLDFSSATIIGSSLWQNTWKINGFPPASLCCWLLVSTSESLDALMSAFICQLRLPAPRVTELQVLQWTCGQFESVCSKRDIEHGVMLTCGESWAVTQSTVSVSFFYLKLGCSFAGNISVSTVSYVIKATKAAVHIQERLQPGLNWAAAEWNEFLINCVAPSTSAALLCLFSRWCLCTVTLLCHQSVSGEAAKEL